MTAALARRAGVVAALAACAGLAAGCGGGDTPSAAQVDRAADEIPLTTTINGTVPPGRVALVTTSTELLSFDRDGQQVRVYRDVRPAGTRAPIHVHGAGGWTCVLEGRAVLYLDGSKPIPTETGGCVNMPPLTPMSNYNPGPGPAVLIDSFVTPPGADIWRIIEKGYTQLGNEFAHGAHTTQTNP